MSISRQEEVIEGNSIQIAMEPERVCDVNVSDDWILAEKMYVKLNKL